MNMRFGSKKVSEREMPRLVKAGPIHNGEDDTADHAAVTLSNAGLAAYQLSEYSGKMKKTRLDQIADLMAQLTYDEMMEYDEQLNLIEKRERPGMFAELFRSWYKQNQAAQLENKLKISED